jgi:hypothetical protein
MVKSRLINFYLPEDLEAGTTKRIEESPLFENLSQYLRFLVIQDLRNTEMLKLGSLPCPEVILDRLQQSYDKAFISGGVNTQSKIKEDKKLNAKQ